MLRSVIHLNLEQIAIRWPYIGSSFIQGVAYFIVLFHFYIIWT
jgi:hypothetical protein